MAARADTFTIGSALTAAEARIADAGADSARLSAMVLLEQATGLRREQLLAHPEAALASDAAIAYDKLVCRRVSREPLAYIVGSREFFGRSLSVTPATLIPRPETEGLVELALLWMRDHPGARVAVDVGTGSGAIAVTLLAEAPTLNVAATDLSLETLATASGNASNLGLSGRLQCIRCNLSDAILGQIDLIVANLPYIATSDIPGLQPEVAEHEPHLALDGGPRGTSLISSLLRDLPRLLRRQGAAFLEIGDSQGAELISEAAKIAPEYRARIERDPAGLDRYLVLEGVG